MIKQFITKNNNKISTFKSGLKKDQLNEKIKYDLIPHELLTRLAGQFTRGARKYGKDNWRQAMTNEEYSLFRESAWRHFVDWSNGLNNEEDHAIAAITNIIMFEWHTKHKKNNGKI